MRRIDRSHDAERRPPKPDQLTVAMVEAAIAVPRAQWVGNCYGIADAMARAKLVTGRVVYGHWIGPIHPDSHFSYARGLPFVHHGWIVLDDDTGAVLDPTRWVFEHVDPYLFIGEPPGYIAPCATCGLMEDEHTVIGPDDQCSDYQPPPRWPYDEGGDIWRAATCQPLPASRPRETQHRIKLPLRVHARLGFPTAPTLQQLLWLANLPYSVLGEDAWAVCAALDAMGQAALIPWDTRTRARADHLRRQRPRKSTKARRHAV